MSPQPLVLLVNDHAGSRYALGHPLRQAGFAVLEAASGGEALRLAREQQPDLVILDVYLPDISGYAVCQRLKADPHTAAIPVLYVSATFTKSEDRVRGLESGADAYLVQPVEPAELLATVRLLLRRRQALAELYAELVQQRRQAEELAAASRLLLEEADVAEVAQYVVDSVCRLFAAQGAVLYRLDEATQELVVVAVSGALPQAELRPGLRLPPQVGAVGLAVERRQVVASADIFADSRLHFPPELRGPATLQRRRRCLPCPCSSRGGSPAPWG
ncbi:MAG: hypothetical protein KatS3mg131_3888 [Candidatus Tectimicrobiota bacterium]|nr:MAG: hypothetical protein KatS3mg131_3888 [Candidatus Tectomicrobia bacterium]